MKKKILLMLMVALFVCLFAISAYAVEINGVHYTLDSDGTATVNKDNRTATNLIAHIPSYVEHDGKTYKVDEIANDAFYGNTTVTEIRILSEFITKIPSSMIANTYSTGALKKIYIDFSNITSIGGAAFNPSNQTNGNAPKENSFYYYDAKAYLADGSDVVITCPDFSNCTYIGSAAFQGANFEKLVIPEAVAINNQVFRKSTITELVLQGENRTTIEYYSFQSCTQLKKIVIESRNLKTVSNDVFAGNINVEEIYIDLSKCERVKSSAFMFSTQYDGGGTKVAWYDLEGNRRVDLSSMKYLEERAFASSNLGCGTHETPTEIAWPKGLISIGMQAFRKANITGTVYIGGEEGANLNLQTYLFGNVTGIDTIIFGKGVTKVSENFFADSKIDGMNVVFLDTVDFTYSSHLFTNCSNVNIYYKEFTGTPTFSKYATLIEIASGTASNYGFCGAIAELVTKEGGAVTVGEIDHNYQMVDYDNTYCPINTMGNYECTKCNDKKQVANEGTAPIKDGHIYNTLKSIIYKDGFLAGGVKVTECICTLEKTENVSAIFEFSGYSTKNNNSSMCVGYKINQDELNAYNSINEELVFGVVASTKTENILNIENGAVVGGANTVVAPVSSNYSSFEFILSGFNEGNSDLALVMCAYAFDGNDVSYLVKTPALTPVTIKELIANS